MKKLSYLRIKQQLPKEVNLLAVSKGIDFFNIKFIHDLGQNHFGESKVQEAIIKQNNFKNNKYIKWHFIGRIQSNKVNKIVSKFDYIHSVDSYKKLLKISNAALQLEKIPKLMIQVKFLDDPNKGGITLEELIHNWSEFKKLRGIKIIGLMTINPKGLTSNENLNLYKKCRSLADTLELSECSMGMSQDWKEALEAGATWIRIGSSIFGERKV